MEQTAFLIHPDDNVATALTALTPGPVRLLNGTDAGSCAAIEDIPSGHKLALRDIAAQEDIIKYGVVIGRATKAIPCGGWVHLHVMRSLYDERSGHLDVKTGAPGDTKYE